MLFIHSLVTLLCFASVLLAATSALDVRLERKLDRVIAKREAGKNDTSLVKNKPASSVRSEKDSSPAKNMSPSRRGGKLPAAVSTTTVQSVSASTTTLTSRKNNLTALKPPNNTPSTTVLISKSTNNSASLIIKGTPSTIIQSVNNHSNLMVPKAQSKLVVTTSTSLATSHVKTSSKKPKKSSTPPTSPRKQEKSKSSRAQSQTTHPVKKTGAPTAKPVERLNTNFAEQKKEHGNAGTNEDKAKDQGSDSIESSNNSHFLAYSLILGVFIAFAYVTYHNRRKIMGLLLEGRSARSNRSRGYNKVPTNVEDVLPAEAERAKQSVKEYVY